MIALETMSMTDKLLSTLAITILGMAVVFVVLVIIAYSLELLKIISGNKVKKEIVEETVEIKTQVDVKHEEDIELIVLLTAAIAAYESTSAENIIVRTIKEMPQKTSMWAAAGRQQQMSANSINIRRS